jgi:hypothetical protein
MYTQGEIFMSNMSYCRFENTSGDLKDCIYAVEEAMEKGTNLARFLDKLSSKEERQAFVRMQDQCVKFLELVDELEQVVHDEA